MKIPNAYQCDECKRPKGPTNHWWLLFVEPDGVRFAPWWEDDVDDADAHLCGEECAHRRLTQEIARMSKEAHA